MNITQTAILFADSYLEGTCTDLKIEGLVPGYGWKEGESVNYTSKRYRDKDGWACEPSGWDGRGNLVSVLPLSHYVYKSQNLTGQRACEKRQSGGRPLRVFYAFDTRRTSILLIGGDKTGNDRFYEEYVPVADELYDQHLEELRKEGLIE